MWSCFGNWLAASPKLNRAAATNCGFSAKQSDNATSNTSEMRKHSNAMDLLILFKMLREKKYLKLSSVKRAKFDRLCLQPPRMLLAAARQSELPRILLIMTAQTLPIHANFGWMKRKKKSWKKVLLNHKICRHSTYFRQLIYHFF